MQTENMQNAFRRGIMSLVVLSLLKRGDMYGYQLVIEAERQSGGRIVTQEGSLYPVLYKLLDQGLISDRKVLVGKRMTRIYYHLEPTGEQKLQDLIREYEEITQAVFQIVRGSDDDDKSSACLPISMAAEQGDSQRIKAEEANPIAIGSLRPGLCL